MLQMSKNHPGSSGLTPKNVAECYITAGLCFQKMGELAAVLQSPGVRFLNAEAFRRFEHAVKTLMTDVDHISKDVRDRTREQIQADVKVTMPEKKKSPRAKKTPVRKAKPIPKPQPPKTQLVKQQRPELFLDPNEVLTNPQKMSDLLKTLGCNLDVPFRAMQAGECDDYFQGLQQFESSVLENTAPHPQTVPEFDFHNPFNQDWSISEFLSPVNQNESLIGGDETVGSWGDTWDFSNDGVLFS